MLTNKYIAYYRVSTQRQGKSGLGLEAQRRAVNTRIGSECSLISEYTEIESGRRADRPKLAEALAACRLHRAILLIAKLDRLSRNVAFVSNLMEAGIEFEAVDFPQANRLTIHILAAVAEHEARMISERTRAALAAAKARGVTLGGWRGRAGTCNDLALATAARTERANRHSFDLSGTIREIQNGGTLSLSGIASRLNAIGICAPRGGMWAAEQVKRTIARLSS
jgi:DNA invertase Pin-like site-specific DNA recombinase